MSGQLIRAKSSRDTMAKHTHVVITLTQGGQLRFVDPRTFGELFVTEADNDPTSLADVRSFMLNTRYWWLEGAPTDTIRRGIAKVFETYDVETIAPGYGCILRGRNVVERHYRMLDDFLKACDKSVMVSRYVGRDEER